MTSVFLTISLLCLWIYVLIIERQNNKRCKKTLNVMKRMWDFERECREDKSKELCKKMNELNHANWTDINELRNIIADHVNNKNIHAVHYEVKTFSMEENKDDKNN